MATDNYVVDTHSLYWYLVNDDRLGEAARHVLDEAASGQAKIFIPSIVVAELYWILEKQAKTGVFAQLFGAIEAAAQFEFVDFKAADVLDFPDLNLITEMHDRMIVATARRMQVPCLKKDQKIASSGLIETVW